MGDALGSVRQLTNEEAEITLTKSYAPYGEVMSTSGSGESAFAFTDEATDANGVTYLRARYYASNTGRFLSRDTWGGDVNSPMSFNLWSYVHGDPINLTDPTGHYADNVHRDLTRKLVISLKNFVPSTLLARDLAEAIAQWDNFVDKGASLQPLGSCVSCHFKSRLDTAQNVTRAAFSGKVYLFGGGLHQLQDYYSHWGEGYTPPLGHAWHSSVLRSSYKLEDFFNGGHLQQVGKGGTAWISSPFPAHPRDEVIKDVQRRNIMLNLNGLDDWKLIDLYLRSDGANMQQVMAERDYFGFKTDLYISGSSREEKMTQDVKSSINSFLSTLAHFDVENRCNIDLGLPPDQNKEREIKDLIQ
jgi:RHS repeat-associated protein